MIVYKPFQREYILENKFVVLERRKLIAYNFCVKRSTINAYRIIVVPLRETTNDYVSKSKRARKWERETVKIEYVIHPVYYYQNVMSI